MAHTIHISGYPRIGQQRELKKALEQYWSGESKLDELEATGRQLRQTHWQTQQDAGLDLLSVGDFAFYDQVLNLSLMLGVVPKRFHSALEAPDLDLGFYMARGQIAGHESVAACEMTKWFDTNYHYLVPELQPNQRFQLKAERLLGEVEEAKALGQALKVVLVGPLTYLWLGRLQGEGQKLDLLDVLLDAYVPLLQQLAEAGVAWVQLDEPILALDLPPDWRQAFESTYNRIQSVAVKKLLAVYFGGLGEQLGMVAHLPVDGLHLDAVSAPESLIALVDRLPAYKVLSAGVVDGRNVWASDLTALTAQLAPLAQQLGERLWLGSACSLQHVPHDLQLETQLDEQVKSWLAFARQKLDELQLLKHQLQGTLSPAMQAAFQANQAAIQDRAHSDRIHRPEVAKRLKALGASDRRRLSNYPRRAQLQKQQWDLPLFPTTTIGSFPQTEAIRQARLAYRQGRLSQADYEQRMKTEIHYCIEQQEALGLDVLVHGEPERNDMVEYFGEQLDGVAISRFGWVQSYGSRCVKPPIIYGDVQRPQPMTVAWSEYAQSLTSRPVKGMLTGPVTCLQWSFVRNDLPVKQVCEQLALALRDEVQDLEKAGIRVIQVDEPALREGLPLRRAEQAEYLRWAVDAFCLTTAGVADGTQIHTHMCYSEFNDIIEAIAALDADVITIETSRSNMNLLQAFEDFAYPNEIGPGVYDIHSPNTPTVEWMQGLIKKAAEKIPPERLWVNPDCGLKTRRWTEVTPALTNLVKAAQQLRLDYL